MASIDFTEEQALTALRAFLLHVLPNGFVVIAGQQNNVPLPKGGVVVMTPLFFNTLSVPATQYDRPAGLEQKKQSKDWRVQLDVYGSQAADMASMLATVFSSSVATAFFDAQNVPLQALYAEDPRNLVFTNESMNYEGRWMLEVHLEIITTVSVQQQFASTLAVGVKEVDNTFTP